MLSNSLATTKSTVPDSNIPEQEMYMGENESKIMSNELILQKKMESNSFHCAMKLPLTIGQFFGLFPIYVGGSSYQSLKVKWFHWRMLFSITTLVLFFLNAIATIYNDLPQKHNILDIDGMVFSITACVFGCLLLILTTEWSNFVQEWHEIESRTSSGNLKKKLNAIVIAVLILAGVEHFLIYSNVVKTSMEAASNISEGLRNYFNTSYMVKLYSIKYSIYPLIILEFMNLQMAFIWNYADIFIMLIGSALKFKLKQVSIRIRNLNKLRTSSIQSWRNLRKDYIRLVSLCETTNKRLSSLIVFSFLVNLYFILKQIFRSLRKIKNPIERAYFYISFILLVTRISLVIIFGSGVHEEWKDIRFLLQSVPSSSFNLEVERLVRTVASYELVLSGKKFFNIRRSLILQIAGTIVSYELILIQNTEMLKNEE